MTIAQPDISINQFAQSPIRGNLDLVIFKSGLLSGIVSPNNSGSLKAGDKVMLDAANTGNVPWFKAAGVSDLAIGFVGSTTKQNTFAVGQACIVAGLLGPVMWMVNAAEAITPQEKLAMDSSGNMIAVASNKLVAIALDPVTDTAGGQLFRAFITTPFGAAS